MVHMKKQHDPADTSVLPAYILLVPSRVPRLHVLFFLFFSIFGSLFIFKDKIGSVRHGTHKSDYIFICTYHLDLLISIFNYRSNCLNNLDDVD
jgi:hypothetical protein